MSTKNTLSITFQSEDRDWETTVNLDVTLWPRIPEQHDRSVIPAIEKRICEILSEDIGVFLKELASE
jgi:hypothetical protein